MTPEIVTIVTVAIGLAGLILSGQRRIAEMRRELAGFREQTRQEFDALRERMAHLEGLLEGLREAIIGKAA